MSGGVALIIPAAGEGARMKSAVRKPFLDLGGRPVLHVVLERCTAAAAMRQVIVAVGPQDYRRHEALLAQLSRFGVTDVVEGGRTRTQTVSNALAALGDEVEVVLIHDAVRPFVRPEVVRGVIDLAARHGAAIAAVPVKDTIKSVKEGVITSTVQRCGLYLAQTPQGFRREVITGVYRGLGGDDYTDDAALVEAAGLEVRIVESTYDNFKITTPEDLLFARALLALGA